MYCDFFSCKNDNFLLKNRPIYFVCRGYKDVAVANVTAAAVVNNAVVAVIDVVEVVNVAAVAVVNVAEAALRYVVFKIIYDR